MRTSLFPVIVMLSFAVRSHADEPPTTKQETVIDVFHGVSVSEDYRWLEDRDHPAVKEWSKQQNQYTSDFLSRLPGTDDIRAQVTRIMSAESVSYWGVVFRGGKYFAMKRQPPKQQPFLVVMDALDDPGAARVLADPGASNDAGTTAIDWFEPSPDGLLVAVSLSKAGTEAGDVHVFDVARGEQVHEVIPRVNTGTAGGDLAWLPDGSGFFYTRHPLPGERSEHDINFFQQAYFHRLGTNPQQDRYEIGKDFPRIAEIEFEMHNPSGQLLLTVQDGDGGQFAHYLRSADGDWRQISRFGDKTVQATFVSASVLIALCRDDAPRGRLDRIDIEGLFKQPVDAERLSPIPRHTVVAEADDTIVTSFYHAPPSILATSTRLFVLYQLGGPSEIRVFDHEGTPQPAPQQMPVSSVGGLSTLEGDDILFSMTSYVSPTSILRFDAAAQTTQKTKLSSSSPVSYDDVEVRREFATSKDGTRIPVNILRGPSAKASGPHPCVVYGYGGYGINLTPRFSAVLKVLLDRGVIYAVANIRGGGEFGEQWHQQGMLTNKQNVFDDFAAACQHLIDQGDTESARLATMGGSNGGLLMGATLTQHPQLMRAVVSYVGIYDMLRVELSPNGSFNIPEFGTVKDPDHFHALRAYSPYHNVRDGQRYPSVFLMTGENDPRVDPMQSRKMAARLQAATASEHPILLRTSSDAGHGGDTPLAERIEQTVDAYSFLLHELGVTRSTLR